MDDEIRLPWSCDDDECVRKWHVSSYAYDELDGEPLWSSFSDGDWEPCDQEDFPPQEEVDYAWTTYYEYVAETGEDPLYEIGVAYSFKRSARWQVRFHRWVGSSEKGLIVSARRNGRGPWLRGRALPMYVQEYLCIDPDKSEDGYLTACDLAGLYSLAETTKDLVLQPRKCNYRMVQGWVIIEEVVNRDESALRNERRKLARKILAHRNPR